jgi:predicted  nucleic acid-binding Zn-ribbon protein
MAKMFLLLFVTFVSSQGFLLDGNTQTGTDGPSLDDKRYSTLMDLLIEERRSRSKLETAVAQDLLVLRQEIAKCQCGNGNGGHTQTINQGTLTNDTKAVEEEIIHIKRDQAILQIHVAGLMQNNTVLKDKVALLERKLTTLQNRQCDLDIRNQTSHLEKELKITDNKLNAVINDANARKQDFIALFQTLTGLNQNYTTLKNNVIQLERNFTIENTKCRNETSQLEKALQKTNNKLYAAKYDANSRNQSFIALSGTVAGLIQNSTVLKDNVIKLERNFTIEHTKCYLRFRNVTSPGNNKQQSECNYK